MTRVSDFDFDLPQALIAQEPTARGASRLLVIDRRHGTFREEAIAHLPRLLQAGDLVVANDTRVFPARLIGRRDPSGGAAECLLLRPIGEGQWEALVHPGSKLKAGARVVFEDGVRAPGVRIVATVLERRYFGRRVVILAFEGAESLEAAVDAIGHVPLPPYIRRTGRPDDSARYQTVFATERGSIAAPTAGLHFDDALVGALRQAGVGWCTITLHVGYGTFKPVRVEQVEDHRVDPEPFTISAATASAVAATKRAGHRIVAVGTTTTRTLEHAGGGDGLVRPGSGDADLFIHPGHHFRVVDALLTNFHLPRSSLLMLVAAFAGVELTLDAYRFAVEREFRFYSYGDAMLIV